jgi:hypothetical protein
MVFTLELSSRIAEAFNRKAGYAASTHAAFIGALIVSVLAVICFGGLDLLPKNRTIEK